MFPGKIKALGTIRYLRPDHNPLRRDIERMHSVIVGIFTIAVLALSPLVAAMVAHAADSAGRRAEHRQAATRHPVQAVVVGVSPGSHVGAVETMRVQWRDAGGTPRNANVPLRKGDRPGLHRRIWLDDAGRPISPPDSHAHTVADAVIMSAVSVIGLWIVLAVTYTGVERRLDRRRFAEWDKEWLETASRWTGRK